ncbi:MAG: alpha/beta fold hydrolase [Bacteroidetes bacterium]|nr:alpha/beta fold hydrolase [Bacteroidota bacterium]
MNRRYKLLITSLILLIAIACYGVYWGIYNVLPYSAIKPLRLTSPLIIEKFKEKYTPNRFNLTLKQFSFTTKDSITLRGWFIPSQYKAKGTILVLHGIASSKQLMLPYASDLVKDSFNVVVYDSRAHGESGGEYCTLGFYEKYDVSKCIDKVIEQFGDSCVPFGILGNSMGAAVALQAIPLDKRIVCGISESSFANLRETLSDYLERMIPVRWDWISSPAFA